MFLPKETTSIFLHLSHLHHSHLNSQCHVAHQRGGAAWHGEKSERSVKMEANSRLMQLTISNSNPGFEKDPERFFSHCFGMLAAHNGNSFVQYRSDLWNMIVHHIPFCIGFTSCLKAEWTYLYRVVSGVADAFVPVEQVVLEEIPPSLFSEKDSFQVLPL
jgi:hypothetical protein